MFQTPLFALPDWFAQSHPARQTPRQLGRFGKSLEKSRSRSSWGGVPTLANDGDCNLHLRGVNVNHSGFRESASLPTPIIWHSPAISRSQPLLTPNQFPFDTRRKIRSAGKPCLPLPDYRPDRSVPSPNLSILPGPARFLNVTCLPDRIHLAPGRPNPPVVCPQRRSPIPDHSR